LCRGNRRVRKEREGKGEKREVVISAATREMQVWETGSE
jgi:hypothetical protein